MFNDVRSPAKSDHSAVDEKWRWASA